MPPFEKEKRNTGKCTCICSFLQKATQEGYKIGYLQAVGRNQVERTVGWGKYECDISLNIYFCMVIISGSMIMLSHTQTRMEENVKCNTNVN